MTTTTAAAEPKPYHHGDLRRALLQAAVTIVERDGANALTLRAVARGAGVSPAAPYHHFKDKDELLQEVAREGFRRLRGTMSGHASSLEPYSREIAYIEFAHDHPALYRVMYDCARNMERLPIGDNLDDDGVRIMHKALLGISVGKVNDIDLAVTAIAAWCACHGLAEISSFAQFDQLKDAMGGEREFLKAMFERFATFRTGKKPAA